MKCEHCGSKKSTPDLKYCADCLEAYPLNKEKKVIKVQLGTPVPWAAVLFKIEAQDVMTNTGGVRREIENIEYCYYEVEL